MPFFVRFSIFNFFWCLSALSKDERDQKPDDDGIFACVVKFGTLHQGTAAPRNLDRITDQSTGEESVCEDESEGEK